jgi:hypothetical protein
MSLISTTIANLINGVSQQPYALRLASQAELQENCTSSVVDGLCKRNGTRHSAKISSTPSTSAFTHLINRDATERYHVVITSGEIKVYDLAGAQKTVNIAGISGNYLVSAAPDEDFVALTVADYTFILNKNILVLKDDSDLSPSRPHEALVWVKQALQDTPYSITVDGFTGNTGTGDASNFPETVNSNAIVTNLLRNATDIHGTGLAYTMGTSAANYVIQNNGSTIRVQRADGTDFAIDVTDGYGDQATQLIKGTTQRFTNLPAHAYNGFKVEVQGEGGSFNQSYWVEYIADASNPSAGVWKEGTKPGEHQALLASTMPHILVREADGTFTFKEATWDKRKVGDLTVSNPMPSFVGRKINDVFFHRNRLGFLSDESMILSTSGEYFNFFKGSAIQVLDTDPIDISVSNTKVAILKHAVPWNEGLLMFSDQTQFMLAKPADILTAKTASIQPSTEYECATRAKPVSVGKFIYFLQERDVSSAVREFSVDAYTQTKDAQDVTSHVPKYVPSGVYKLAPSNTESMLVALSKQAPNKMFVYQFYMANDTKLQSAWHTWTFGANDTILNADFIGSDLRLVISRPDGLYLEVVTVNTAHVDAEGSQPFSVHLDRRLTEAQCTTAYSAGTNQTTITLPFTPQAGEDFKLVAWSGNADFKVGQKVTFTRAGNVLTVTKPGNLQHYRFGRTVVSRYRFSQFEIRENSAGGGQTAVGEGRVNVRRMTLTFGKSGYFRIEVTPRGRDTSTAVMTGRQVGNSLSPIGSPALIEGVIHAPVMARNIDVTIEVVSEEFLPFSLLSADWEGMYVIRSRRV